MDNDTARIVGGIYIALCKGLSEEGARLAHDCLFGFASNSGIRAEDRRVFQCIANAASRDVDELRAENDRLDLLEAGPTLRVVGGSSVTT